MSDKDASHLIIELQEARYEIDKLCKRLGAYKRESYRLIDRIAEFDGLVNLVVEKTAVKVGGELHWPEWLVNKLDDMGLKLCREMSDGR